MEIGHRIKKFRELKDIPRKEIANRLHISLSAYSKNERGEVDLTISRAKEIANILNVDFLKLLTFDLEEFFILSKHTNLSDRQSKSDSHIDRYIFSLEEEIKRLNEKLSS